MIRSLKQFCPAMKIYVLCMDEQTKSDIMVASNTYIATILAIVRAGHKPVLVEPELATFNMDAAIGRTGHVGTGGGLLQRLLLRGV